MLLQTRLLASLGLTVLLIILLLVGVVLERSVRDRETRNFATLKDAARFARELSLYVQYNAHDTNAYTLGHLEHGEEFIDHQQAFVERVAMLESMQQTEALPPLATEQLQAIRDLRVRYVAASEQLFAAADANRLNPSAATQQAEDAAWEESDVLGDELDAASQALATTFDTAAAAVAFSIETRNQQALAGIVVVGTLLVLLIAGVNGATIRALTTPTAALVAGMQRVAAGNYTEPVPVSGRHEVAAIATTFNRLTADIARQVTTVREQAAVVATQNRDLETLLGVVRELEIPVIPVLDGVLLVPLVGHLTTKRIERLSGAVLETVHHQRAQRVLLDVTSVVQMDLAVAAALEQTVQAVRLLGAQVVISGISAGLAQTLSVHQIRFAEVRTVSTLADALRELEQQAPTVMQYTRK